MTEQRTEILNEKGLSEDEKDFWKRVYLHALGASCITDIALQRANKAIEHYRRESKYFDIK